MPEEIKDHRDRGVQVEVEDGMLVITHAEGKLKMFAEHLITLMGEMGRLAPHLKFKAKPEFIQDRGEEVKSE